MESALRNAILAAIPNHDEVAWAGVVAECRNEWIVHVLRTPVNASSGISNVETRGAKVRICTLPLEKTNFLDGSPHRFVDMLEIPIPDARLLGRAPADLLAPRMNAALIEERIAGALAPGVRDWLERVSPAKGVGGIMALKGRALYAYAEEHGCFPTQADFNAYLMQHQEPWAVALCAPSREAGDMRPQALNLGGVSAASVQELFLHHHWLDRWAGPDGPRFAGRYQPPETSQVQTSSGAQVQQNQEPVTFGAEWATDVPRFDRPHFITELAALRDPIATIRY